jgi:16S rRNA processing protein RimM
MPSRAAERDRPTSPDRWVNVGCVGKPQGLKGELVVHFYGDTPARFAPGETVSMLHNGTRRELRVATSREMPKKLIVRFEGCTRIEDVESWRGAELQVRAEDLPDLEDGAFYHFELLGLSVYTADGQCLGTLEKIIGTGSNDVYCIRGNGREYLVPATEDAIESIDPSEGRIILKDMKGLIEP